MIQLSVTLPERDIQTHRDGAAAEYLHSIVVTPPLVCNMVFHQCNAVWHSVEYLFGKWHEHISLLKLPLLCTDTLRAMRQDRGEYFSKNFYFCTTPKNGSAQESCYAW